VGSCEQVVGRPSVSKHAPLRVERVPAHGRKHGVLAKFANVDLDSFPRRDTGPAICVNHLSEVIAHGVAIRHMDRNTFPNREKGREAKLGHALQIALRVSTDVLVHNLVDRRWHGRTLAPVGSSVNAQP
jgi:hypothetical protein